VHLAEYCDFSGEPSPLYDSVTVKGTERLLTALEEFELEQFVFSSTMLVHAPGAPGVPVSEDSLLLPQWDYPRSKVAAEKVIHARRGRIPAAILRIAGVYDDLCHSAAIANQMRRIYERKRVSHVFPGDISHGQAFVHVDDVAEAVALCVTRRGRLPAETPILIGEPETPSYDELQRTLGELIHGETWETRQIPKALAKAGTWLEDAAPDEEPFIKPWMVDLVDDHYELDIARARLLLGWQPLRSLRASLPRMVEALRANPQRFYRENQLETSAAPESHDGRTDELSPRALSHAR
jgi:nucleoside-diphosphate-sugar epimerase